MPEALAIARRTFRASVSRLDEKGQPLCEFPRCAVRITAATPPSAPTPEVSKLEGLEVAEFTMGEAPRLELDVPIQCVSDYVRLLRGRLGMRKEDASPLSVDSFNVFRERDFLTSDVPLALLIKGRYSEYQQVGFLFHAVDLRVVGSRHENGNVSSVRVRGTPVQDIAREFADVVGQAGELVVLTTS